MNLDANKMVKPFARVGNVFSRAIVRKTYPGILIYPNDFNLKSIISKL